MTVTTNDPYTPLDCSLHDHLELVCLRRYRIRLRSRDGDAVEGTACTLRSVRDDGEYLELDRDGETREIRLDRVAHLDVLDPGAPFATLAFAPED